MLTDHFQIRGTNTPGLSLKACRGELDLTIPGNSKEGFKLKNCHEITALIASEQIARKKQYGTIQVSDN